MAARFIIREPGQHGVAHPGRSHRSPFPLQEFTAHQLRQCAIAQYCYFLVLLRGAL
jgi:hypothetical protein